MASRPPLPPFTEESAKQKVRMAENSWNTRDAAKVALAYTEDTRWRNRAIFVENRSEAETFLKDKWQNEHDYRLIKELWAFRENRIAVRYAYEWRNDNNQWFRSYGNENWQFAANGLMHRRHASINDLAITPQQRLFHWTLGVRPDATRGSLNWGCDWRESSSRESTPGSRPIRHWLVAIRFTSISPTS